VPKLTPKRLEQLQSMPYEDYLKSEEWQAKRKQALAYAENRCQLCNGDGELHVHHRTYDRRGAEMPQDLIVLCKDCHEKFHNKGSYAERLAVVAGQLVDFTLSLVDEAISHLGAPDEIVSKFLSKGENKA
jgi:hypothetical protein